MDLLSITRTLWRRRVLVVPVVALTIAGLAYVAVLTKPLYQMTIDYVFVPPPNPPTPAQIAQDPSLGMVDSINVFSRFSDQSIVADSIISRMTSSSMQQELVDAGADKRFTVSPVSLYGSPEPMVEVAGTGSTAAEAQRTGALVGAALRRSLYSMQRSLGTNPDYMFTALQVGSSPPRLKVSGKLRSMAAVVGVGALLLFMVVSVADALEERRGETQGSRSPTIAVMGGGPGIVANGSTGGTPNGTGEAGRAVPGTNGNGFALDEESRATGSATSRRPAVFILPDPGTRRPQARVVGFED